MTRKKVMLTANADCKLKELGARIKRARLRRNMSAESLSEKAGIGESTFYAIERGKPTVSIGAYVAVLIVLGIDGDIDTIAIDEDAKKQLYEQNIVKRKRASRARTE
jgi:transcriptional regulator with XRE-family HTH domain